MTQILINTIALEPNRWTRDRMAHFDLEQLLAPIAGAGFHFVELWQFHISRATEKEIKAYKEMADALNLSFPVVGIYPSLHLAGVRREEQLARIKLLMTYANLLGTEIVKTFVGSLGSQQLSDSEYVRSIDFMQEVLELAATHDLTIACETHQNTLFDTLQSCHEAMSAIDSENLKVCFQPFDFADTEKAISDYQALADDVIHLHYQGQKDGKYDLLSNSDLDYKKLTKAVVDNGFSGKISVEFVKDCVVATPQNFDIQRVLRNAILDRDFIAEILAKVGRTEFAW